MFAILLGVILIVWSLILIGTYKGAYAEEGSKRRRYVITFCVLLALFLVNIGVCTGLICSMEPQLQNAETSTTSSTSSSSSSFASNGLDALTLDGLEACLGSSKYNTGETLVYIGSADDAASQAFEKVLTPLLEKKGSVIPMYYTSQDSTGKNSAKMEKFLAKEGVTSIPCVLLVNKGKIEKRWFDPTKSIAQIEKYL